MGDVFRLEEGVTRGIVESLALPLAGRGAPTRRPAPTSALAYELYLRGNGIGRQLERLPLARDLYLRCLEEDPAFAPAWAQLGRCHRVIGKFLENERGNRERAEEAFRRAFALDPELPAAHRFYTHFEAELGRAVAAMTRLVRHAQSNRNDPELFVGLVHACRYAGLLEVSAAAHEEARRLDPNAPTSLPYTLFAAGDFERLNSEAEGDGTVVDLLPRAVGLAFQGRPNEARTLLARTDLETLPSGFRISLESVRAYVEGNPEEILAVTDKAIAAHSDPEARFVFGSLLVRAGHWRRGLEVLTQVLDDGFTPVTGVIGDSGPDDPLAAAGFRELLAKAERKREEALAAWQAAGGDRLLGA